jgi:hypothetical protein
MVPEPTIKTGHLRLAGCLRMSVCLARIRRGCSAAEARATGTRWHSVGSRRARHRFAIWGIGRIGAVSLVPAGGQHARSRRDRRSVKGMHDGIVKASCGGCGLDRSNDPLIANGESTPCSRCGETQLIFDRSQTSEPPPPDSVPTALSPELAWRLRWELLELTLARVTCLHAGEPTSIAAELATQGLFAFFVSAYRFNVVLITSGVASEHDVEAAIARSPTLSLLADLAGLDGEKRLTGRPTSLDAPRVESVAGVSTGAHWRLAVSIRHGGVLIDGATFAARALGVVPEDVVHPGLLGGWLVSKPPVPRRTPDEVAR